MSTATVALSRRLAARAAQLRCRRRSELGGAAAYKCTYRVRVDGLQQSLALDVQQFSDEAAKPTTSWDVVYDPDRPQETLTVEAMTPAVRAGLIVAALVALALLAASYVASYAYRDDAVWQNVSGVWALATVASSVVGAAACG